VFKARKSYTCVETLERLRKSALMSKSPPFSSDLFKRTRTLELINYSSRSSANASAKENLVLQGVTLGISRTSQKILCKKRLRKFFL
jgi:hypothetical protein